MYRSLRPVYEELHRVLNARFGPEGSEKIRIDGVDHPVLQGLDRGFSVTLERPHTKYPFAFLEWGQVTEMEFFRAPEMYTYTLTYRLFYFISMGVNISNQVFRPQPEGIYGIGDFVEAAVKFFWDSYHTGRFASAWADTDLWQINDLNIDAGIVFFGTTTDATLLAILSHLQNDPSIRAAQLNFNFEITETINRPGLPELT